MTSPLSSSASSFIQLLNSLIMHFRMKEVRRVLKMVKNSTVFTPPDYKHWSMSFNLVGMKEVQYSLTKNIKRVAAN